MNAFSSESLSDNRKSKIKNPKSVGFLAIVLTLACGVGALAQQPAKIPKIGYLAAGSASANSGLELFRLEFSKLGYVEGKNMAFESRYAANKLDRLPALADELVRLKVDILVTIATPAALAAKNAARGMPSFLWGWVIPSHLGWLIASRGLGATSRD